MKAIHMLGLTAVMSAALIFAAARADAEPRPVGGGPRHLPPPPVNLPVGGFFPGVYVYERETVHVIEKAPEPPPPPAPAAPPPEPRKPYVIGNSYASLPSGCMKMIADGASYYHCNGEWYRQVGAQYTAVRQP
jgi:hypothetical protein